MLGKHFKTVTAQEPNTAQNTNLLTFEGAEENVLASGEGHLVVALSYLKSSQLDLPTQQ